MQLSLPRRTLLLAWWAPLAWFALIAVDFDATPGGATPGAPATCLALLGLAALGSSLRAARAPDWTRDLVSVLVVVVAYALASGAQWTLATGEVRGTVLHPARLVLAVFFLTSLYLSRSADPGPWLGWRAALLASVALLVLVSWVVGPILGPQSYTAWGALVSRLSLRLIEPVLLFLAALRAVPHLGLPEQAAQRLGALAIASAAVRLAAGAGA